MENTLDSIRPSENPQEELSYLFGRDPSILAYNQRPLPSNNTKKNLLSLYETDESNSTNQNLSEHSESQTLQTVKVYLRLKPFPKKLKITEEQQEAYKIINPTTLVTKLPIIDNNSSSLKQSKSSEIICRKFTFSQTFGPKTTQLELFEQTVQQQMIDFLAGHNCTIMTYGTTNSGKSHTLQGTTTSPGLIPRALEFVFSNITTRLNPSYKPLHCCDVINLNPFECAQELEIKTKLLTFSSVDKHQYMNTYKQMQKLLQEESVRPSQCHDAHYSIWVSFAEIYNEIVYDLLSNECQKKRVPLKLGTDSNGRAFIKGLKSVYVNSAEEAYQILMAGQYNLKIAATALNAKSSRSHCIFTIILLKYYTENLPDTVEMSTFSFCDLAGSERLKKTLNIGDRLKEAQNINTSLLVLGRCLKSIHEGQLTRTKIDAIGPFRESKLTRLFQQALSGKEHLALIVNVNPLPNLYIETQNVLNFSAIAKKIVIERKKQIQKKVKSRFTQIVAQSIQTVTDWDAIENLDWQHTDIVEENTSKYVTSEEYMDLAKENERLTKEIAVLQNSALIRDFQSRQEMAEKYIAMINKLEIDWKQRINDVETQHEDALEWTVKQIEIFYEEKLNKLHKKKRKRSDYSDNSDEDNDDNFNLALKKLSEENTQLREKIEILKKTLSELKITNETLIVEKNKGLFEMKLTKEELKVAKNLMEAAQKDICFNEDGKIYIKEITSQLLAKDEQIKKLKDILNEAKDEYLTITYDLRKKELCVDEQANLIVVNEEKIEDLQSHLEQANICLTEKTRVAELLEEKLERQNEKLSDTENKVLQLQEEINQLKNEKLVLLESFEKPTSKTSIKNEYQNIIKEELITDDDISADINNITENMQSLKIKELTEELCDMKETMQSLREENRSKIAIIDEYEHSVQVLEKQLSLAAEEKQKIEGALLNSNVAFEQKIADHNREIDELKKNLFTAKDDAQRYLEKLATIQKEFDNYVLNCKQVKEEYVCKSEEFIPIKEDNNTNNVSAKQLDEQTEKILQLEKSLETVTKLEHDIIQLNENLKICQTEKDCIQKMLNENNEKLLQLENRLKETALKEQEKDTEIISLQKELKHMIQKKENIEKIDNTMEAELKCTLNELTQMRETLLQKEQHIKELKICLENYEWNAKILNLLEDNTKERQIENERLRNLNDELKSNVLQKEREMDAFMRNRDETVTKYEDLVKNQQEELDRQKTEVMKYQELFGQLTTTPNKDKEDDYKKLQNRIEVLQNRLQKYEAKAKDCNDTTSEDEVLTKRQPMRRGKKTLLSTNKEDTSAIELSESDSKRSTRRIALPHPETSTEKKRTTRKKRLFSSNVSFVDIEPSKNATSTLTRNLRNRKK